MFRINKPIKDVWYITTFHGGKASWYKYGKHQGIDLRTKCDKFPNGIGTPIYACKSGIWKTVEESENMGKKIVLEHENGFLSVYGHLSSTTYRPGYKTVKMGDIIGYSGVSGRLCYGPHLHFEILNSNGASLDPLQFINNGEELRNWARARSLMRVEKDGSIKLLTVKGIVEVNRDNCFDILSENCWGISEKDYSDLLELL